MRFARQRTRLTSARGIAALVGIALVVAGSVAGGDGAARAQTAGRAVLDPPAEPLVASAFRAAGFDPAAPRTLVLWRFDGARLDRLGESRSGPDGRFDFGLQPLPVARADFGVTGLGEAPDPGTFRRYERAVPAPVVASDEVSADGAPRTLLVLTARSEGELRIRDAASGRWLARIPVATTPRPGTAIDLDRWLPSPVPHAIAIEHRLDDGRVSPPEIWILEAAIGQR